MDPTPLAEALAEAVAAADIACVELRLAAIDDPAHRRAAADRLIPVAQSAGVALLLADDAELAAAAGADGVVLDGTAGAYDCNIGFYC